VHSPENKIPDSNRRTGNSKGKYENILSLYHFKKVDHYLLIVP